MKDKLRRAIDEFSAQGRRTMPLGNILEHAGISIPQGPEIEVLIQILDELAAENVISDHSAKGRWGKVTGNGGDIFFSVGEKIGFL
jgi:hypothetical protein